MMDKDQIHEPMSHIKIIDVSLRDGGYLNNWQFDREQLKKVSLILDSLKLDFVEVGYLNDRLSLGMDDKSALCLLEEIKKNLNHSQLSIMVNPKYKEVKNKLCHFSDYITFIRIPSDFINIRDALILAEHIKRCNIKVSLNLISITQYTYDELMDFIITFNTSGLIDMLYVADSRGSLQPAEAFEYIKIIKSCFNQTVGFHGHDNLNLAFENSLMAVKAGCEFVDGSVEGYGLGGGNTRLDILMKHFRGMDTGSGEGKAIFHELKQVLDLAKPREMELYRFSAEKNMEQEWVAPILEKYGKDSSDIIKSLTKKSYKNCEDIHDIISKNREEIHAGH